MDFCSYVEYVVYLLIVFSAGFVVGYFWNRIKEGRHDSAFDRDSD